GSDGSVLQNIQLKGPTFAYLDYTVRLGSVADLDGDGHRDLLIPQALGGGGYRGRVFAWSTATWAPLWAVYGENPNDNFGASTLNVGDVDGDGVDDLAAGAPFYPQLGSYQGAVYVYSGAAQGLIWKVEGAGNSDFFGLRMGLAGDMDGDGRQDLLVTHFLSSGSGKSVDILSG